MTESTFQPKKPQLKAITSEYKICSCAAGCGSGLHHSSHVGTRREHEYPNVPLTNDPFMMVPQRQRGFTKEINRHFSHYFKASFSPTYLLSVHASSPLRTFTVTRQHIHIFWTNLQELSPGLHCHFSLYLQAAAAGPNPPPSFYSVAMLCRNLKISWELQPLSQERCSEFTTKTWLWHVADQKRHRVAHQIDKGRLKRTISYIIKRRSEVENCHLPAAVQLGSSENLITEKQLFPTMSLVIFNAKSHCECH